MCVYFINTYSLSITLTVAPSKFQAGSLSWSSLLRNQMLMHLRQICDCQKGVGVLIQLLVFYISLPFTRGFSSTGGRNNLIIIRSFHRSPSNHGTFLHFPTFLLSSATSPEIIFSSFHPQDFPFASRSLVSLSLVTFRGLKCRRSTLTYRSVSFSSIILDLSQFTWKIIAHLWFISGFWGDYSHTIPTTVSPIDLLLSYHSYTQRNAV